MFTTPSQGFSPEVVGSGVPQDSLLPIVGPETRHVLFEHMEQEVEAGTLSQASASWLLHVAFESPEEAGRLMHRFTRPGGFNGPNHQVND